MCETITRVCILQLSDEQVTSAEELIKHVVCILVKAHRIRISLTLQCVRESEYVYVNVNVCLHARIYASK